MNDLVYNLFKTLQTCILAWAIYLAGNAIGDQYVRSVNRQYEIFQQQNARALQGPLKSGDVWSPGKETLCRR